MLKLFDDRENEPVGNAAKCNATVASSATEELDVLMASLSTFKVESTTTHPPNL